MLEITINGKKYQVEKNQTILQAAQKCGVDIPHFCYHPCLSIAGNCRICLVKVEGWGDLTLSCLNTVVNDMKIDTECEEVLEARKSVMQFLTLNHPVDCGVCDKSGECLLQDHHFSHNGEKSLSVEPKNHQTKFYEVSERILLDNERCIVCGRCVRFMDEVSKSHALSILKRGDQAIVRRIDPHTPLVDAYSDNIIDICPVGALLSKDFLYKDRVWFLKDTQSICPGCDRGCQIKIWSRKNEFKLKKLDYKNNQIARITPQISPEINGHWICNKARDLDVFFKRPRLSSSQVQGRDVSFDNALKKIQELLSKSKKTAFIVSSWGSNEEFIELQTHFPNEFEYYVKDDILPSNDEIIEDQFLIRKNKNPNRFSAVKLFGSKDFPRGELFDLVIIWGEGFDLNLLDNSTRIIQFTNYTDNVSKKALVLIALSTMLERNGHYTNGLGVTSPFQKIFDPPSGVVHAVDLFKELRKIL